MGLCKCPQRKITNIFCYEHRVNVCEHCLMNNHSKCVVDTYRNWITDSVYSSKCVLCEHELAERDTVRLLCFHIVHWDCLDSWARSLPPTTAPAGYTCPVCRKMCLFPALNQISPIADVLREKMGEVNWARAGLGLALLDEEIVPVKKISSNGIPNDSTSRPYHLSQDSDQRSDVSDGSAVYESSKFHRHSNVETHSHAQDGQAGYNKLNNSYGNAGHYNANSIPPKNPRKSIRNDGSNDCELLLVDEDDNKYRRRSPFESLSRWLKNVAPAGKRRANRRRALYVILSIIVLVILLMVLFGRRNDDDDNFIPQANPNVLIGEGPPLHHEIE
ncbi:unnamed protein product [Allacma fusca]|uniref:Zinc finger protein-like 1 homolog n=1 Tax=Allacma fusca TaxID=39272 RepID=A0A8J2JAX6_9HEXA|nr:unnamed protein product [Allacma fusca]